VALAAVGSDGTLKPRVSLRGKSHVDQYDPNGFYVKATNHHDHSAQRRVDMDPDVVAQVEKLIASGALVGTPIDGMGAFIRDAMYHNIERLRKIVTDPIHSARLQAVADDYRRLAHADSITRDVESKRQIVQGAREALDGAFSAKDERMVGELLDLYEPMVERLREPYDAQLDEILKAAESRRK